MSQEATPVPVHGLLLSDDMIFTSRITGVGRDLGLSIKAAGSVPKLLALRQTSHPRCIIVDLQNPGLDIPQLVQSLKIDGEPSLFLVGYGSHVDAATLKK